PNSIQPSAMRWRVGRKPTSRNMVLTSCHGHPVSAERCSSGTGAASTSVLLKTSFSEPDMAFPWRDQEDGCICNRSNPRCKPTPLSRRYAGPRVSPLTLCAKPLILGAGGGGIIDRSEYIDRGERKTAHKLW